MLINILVNPNKYKHHKKLITKLVKVNLIMKDNTVSDKGGCIVRDSEYYPTYMNQVVKTMIKKG